MFYGVLNATLNAIVPNPIKRVEAGAIIKNGNFHRVKNGRIKIRNQNKDIANFLDIFLETIFKYF